nr:DUF2461 domain-containing protein [Bacteroidota bacterium]
MQTIITFLQALESNNSREWFQSNKDWYDQARQSFVGIVDEVIKGVSAFDPELQLLTPKDCIFRIYRDVRFSKNKDPYKTNMGAAFCKGGRKSEYGGYYLHFEPGASFIGGGKWQPDPKQLKAIRYEIFQNPDEFGGILEGEKFKKLFGDMDGEKLQRPPKDFPADFEGIEWLKHKSFTVGKQINDEVEDEHVFIQDVLDQFKTMQPFIQFLNRAVAQS